METEGLVTRVRNSANRRVHQVGLTETGEALFRQLAGAARAHDRRLRAHLNDQEIDRLRALLDRLLGNVDPNADLESERLPHGQHGESASR